MWENCWLQLKFYTEDAWQRSPFNEGIGHITVSFFPSDENSVPQFIPTACYLMLGIFYSVLYYKRIITKYMWLKWILVLQTMSSTCSVFDNTACIWIYWLLRLNSFSNHNQLFLTISVLVTVFTLVWISCEMCNLFQGFLFILGWKWEMKEATPHPMMTLGKILPLKETIFKVILTPNSSSLPSFWKCPVQCSILISPLSLVFIK